MNLSFSLPLFLSPFLVNRLLGGGASAPPPVVTPLALCVYTALCVAVEGKRNNKYFVGSSKRIWKWVTNILKSLTFLLKKFNIAKSDSSRMCQTPTCKDRKYILSPCIVLFIHWRSQDFEQEQSNRAGQEGVPLSTVG